MTKIKRKNRYHTMLYLVSVCLLLMQASTMFAVNVSEATSQEFTIAPSDTVGLAMFRKSNPYVQRLTRLIDAKEFASAEALIDTLHRLSPDNIRLYRCQRNMYRAMGDSEKASKCQAKEMELLDAFMEPRILARQKNEALEHQRFEPSPDTTGNYLLNTRSTYMVRLRRLLSKKEAQQALLLLDTLNARVPNHPLVYRYQADAYRILGDKKKQMESVNKEGKLLEELIKKHNRVNDMERHISLLKASGDLAKAEGMAKKYAKQIGNEYDVAQLETEAMKISEERNKTVRKEAPKMPTELASNMRARLNNLRASSLVSQQVALLDSLKSANSGNPYILQKLAEEYSRLKQTDKWAECLQRSNKQLEAIIGEYNNADAMLQHISNTSKLIDYEAAMDEAAEYARRAHYPSDVLALKRKQNALFELLMREK